MSNTLTQYRMFDETIENKVRPLFLLKYHYLSVDDEYVELKLSDDGQGTVLEDAHDTWEFRDFGLIIEGELFLQNVDFLFGQDGLVADDATIGVSLQISSKKSSQQKIRPIGEFNKVRNFEDGIKFKETLEKNKFYGTFCIKINLYVKESGSNPPLGNANIPGMILGTVVEQVIDIDGSMSTLPIQKINNPLKPLWYVEYDIEDATIDSFDTEHVCIYFNTAHPGAKNLEKHDSSIGTFLQHEVLASALTLIITHVKSLPEWDYIERGENLEEGSIGATIYYFRSTFNWNFESPEQLSESIRIYFKTLGEE